MSRIRSWLDTQFYPKYADNWDVNLFRSFLLQYLNSEFAVLDIGAGRGHLPDLNFRSHAKFVAGVDPDPVVLSNPMLHEAKQLPLPSGVVPYPDNYFDLVFSNSVLEHVENPESLFLEAYRVLKPGGILVSKTPNRRHYVPLIASITPLRFHKYINARRGRNTEDTFPTVYACNTPSDIQELAQTTGFQVVDMQLWEGRPEYLRTWFPTYLAGILYERAVNHLPFLDQFRCVLVFALRSTKPA